MSPELLNPEMFGIPQSEGDSPTRQSDCYALRMVIYEVRIRASPFAIGDNQPGFSRSYADTTRMSRFSRILW
jgi:hypothetical protein